MMRAVVVLLVMSAVAHVASASPVRFSVTGDVCDLSSLEGQVTSLVGADRVDAAAHASVRIQTVATSTGISADVYFDDSDGVSRGPRVIDAKSCKDLLDALA